MIGSKKIQAPIIAFLKDLEKQNMIFVQIKQILLFSTTCIMLHLQYCVLHYYITKVQCVLHFYMYNVYHKSTMHVISQKVKCVLCIALTASCVCGWKSTSQHDVSKYSLTECVRWKLIRKIVILRNNTYQPIVIWVVKFAIHLSWNSLE